MVCLYLLIQKRKFLRNCVNIECNKLKHDILTSPIEMERIKRRVEKLANDLDVLNAEILNLKFPGDSEYSLLEKEFVECEDYSNKCLDIIATLDTIEIDSSSINVPHSYTNRYNMNTPTETNNHIELVSEFREEIVITLSSETLNTFLMDNDERNESKFDNTVTHSEQNGHVQLANQDTVCNLSYEILDETSVKIEEINEKADSSNMITHTEQIHNDEAVNKFGEVLYSSSHNLVHDKKVNEKELNVVTPDALKNQYCLNTPLYANTCKNDTTEENEHLVHFAFQNGETDSISKPNMSLFLGGQAYYMSREINNLDLMKQVIMSQENEDIVKRIKNFKYLRKECLETSLLPFMNGDKIDKNFTMDNVDFLPNTCDILFRKVPTFPNQNLSMPNLRIDKNFTTGNVDFLPNTCEILFRKVPTCTNQTISIPNLSHKIASFIFPNQTLSIPNLSHKIASFIFPNQTLSIPNLSHKIASFLFPNQTLSMPNLSNKIASCLIHSRSKLMLGGDLKKAFNTISLIEVDQIQLLCLFGNPPKQFYTVRYHNLSLCLYMCWAHTILLILVPLYVLNFNVGNNEREMKKLKSFLYLLYYMSNGTPPNNGKESSFGYSIIHSNSKSCFFGLHFFIIDLLVDKFISNAYFENYSPIDEFLELHWETPTNVLRVKVPTSFLNSNTISNKNQDKYILNCYQIGNHQYFESTVKYSQFPMLYFKPKYDIFFISKLKLKLTNQLPFDRGKVHICPSNSVEHDTTTSLSLRNKVPKMQWKNDQSQSCSQMP